MSSSRAVPVTLAEIARIAGVGRAAVSNWRRRHASFPARIGGTDVSPQFSLAEVEEWLRSHDKLKDVGGREWLWPELEALRSRDEAGLAIAAAGQLLSGGQPATDVFALSAAAENLVRKAVELGQREDPAETFGFLLRRWLDANVRQISTTPDPLAALMAEAAVQMLQPHASQAGSALTVLDPACGTGHLLAAAAAATGGRLTLIGCDKDPTLAALAAARLSLAAAGATTLVADIRPGDSLRADPHADVRADIVLCNPPFNERDWGYEELATDPRWAHGMPPRTEPELAWVQHALARLRPGGTAVLLLPPTAASRKAGRRIRGSLLRSGVLRAVVALPPGCAQPHSLSLHLWVLRAPAGTDQGEGSGTILLADAAPSSRAPRQVSDPDWTALGAFMTSAIGAAGSSEHRESVLPDGIVRMAAIDLLDDEVDLTPGRRASRALDADGPRLAETWHELAAALGKLGDTGKLLAELDVERESGGTYPATTVGDLARAGALVMRIGHQPADGTVRNGKPSGDGVPLLTVPDLLLGGAPRGWLSAADASAGDVVLAKQGDVVIAGVLRAFSAWVHEGPPMALGPQLFVVRVSPEQLDAWFLAGCLRAPSNGRQASTHVSNSSRVDVRRLQVRQMPLEEQRRYSEAFRRIAAFEKLLGRVADLGSGLARDLSDALVAGEPPDGS